MQFDLSENCFCSKLSDLNPYFTASGYCWNILQWQINIRYLRIKVEVSVSCIKISQDLNSPGVVYHSPSIIKVLSGLYNTIYHNAFTRTPIHTREDIGTAC